MEFHDILHGHIIFKVGDELTALLHDLINSPEIHRLRNMRQMNFDVPLIQELGRSRRLPHSIGVANLAYKLAKNSLLTAHDAKALVAAAILHDAAIPPYGHLVESEFKALGKGFKHEKRVEDLIRGTINPQNKFISIVPEKTLEVSDILNRHGVDHSKVIEIICPASGKKSPIAADIDLDNIDNVHRMAAMLGWEDAHKNFSTLEKQISLRGLGEMGFPKTSIPQVEKWLDFRQRIYTMIIAHPECIPYNALQADLVRLAIQEELITPDHWYLTEPVFEEALRHPDSKARPLAMQLISGCDYQLVDYVWLKNFQTDVKKYNSEIVRHMSEMVPHGSDFGYFVWNEKGLISRKIMIRDKGWNGEEIGSTSSSCMISLVKKTTGRAKWTKNIAATWRKDVMTEFARIFQTNDFEMDFPENYVGSFLGSRNNEIRFTYS